MRLRVLITDEAPEEFKTKRGDVVKQRAITCVDMCLEGPRMSTPIIIPLNPTEEKQYSGKIKDRFAVVDVDDMDAFGKRFKCRMNPAQNHIVSIEGVK